jgi:hypothetical protein
MSSTWTAGLKAIAGVAPAVLLVLFAGLLALLGLACEPGRRAYALAYVDRFTVLAAVLVGRTPQTEPAGSPHPEPEELPTPQPGPDRPLTEAALPVATRAVTPPRRGGTP